MIEKQLFIERIRKLFYKINPRMIIKELLYLFQLVFTQHQFLRFYFFTIGIIGTSFYFLASYSFISDLISHLALFLCSFSSFSSSEIYPIYYDFSDIEFYSSLLCYIFIPYPFFPCFTYESIPINMLFLYSIQAFLSAIFPSINKYLKYLSFKNH